MFVLKKHISTYLPLEEAINLVSDNTCQNYNLIKKEDIKYFRGKINGTYAWLTEYYGKTSIFMEVMFFENNLENNLENNQERTLINIEVHIMKPVIFLLTILCLSIIFLGTPIYFKFIGVLIYILSVRSFREEQYRILNKFIELVTENTLAAHGAVTK